MNYESDSIGLFSQPRMFICQRNNLKFTHQILSTQKVTQKSYF